MVRAKFFVGLANRVKLTFARRKGRLPPGDHAPHPSPSSSSCSSFTSFSFSSSSSSSSLLVFSPYLRKGNGECPTDQRSVVLVRVCLREAGPTKPQPHRVPS
ncbi:unnamed protein product [Prorocentrum cordatum]|uniref:Uncharacterized protein n=1 Tax=Prorocentrum cordatum TaxID=2364126 RepID=A0ABN9VU15_9DINO|nr:unnamed protein product [Polarella glacialis]